MINLTKIGSTILSEDLDAPIVQCPVAVGELLTFDDAPERSKINYRVQEIVAHLARLDNPDKEVLIDGLPNFWIMPLDGELRNSGLTPVYLFEGVPRGTVGDGGPLSLIR